MLADPVRGDRLAAAAAALDDGDWAGHAGFCADAAALAGDPAARLPAGAAVLHALAAGLPEATCAALLRAAVRALPPRRMAYPATARLARRPLRVAYLADLDPTGVAAFVLPAILAAHDRTRVEPLVYAIGGDVAPLRARIAAAGALLRPIEHLRPHEAEGLARCDDLDVLVDMCGIAHPAASALLVLDGARAQCALLAGPSVAPDALDSPGLPPPPEGFGTDGAPPASGDDARPDDRAGCRLLCAAGPRALGPAAVDALLAVLAACPEATLWLPGLAGAPMPALPDRIAAAGIASDRVRLAAPPGAQSPAAWAAAADVCAEPLDSGAAAGCLAALAAGVPLVSPRGSRLGTRIAPQWLADAGLDACVADDRAAYVRLLVRLCGEARARQAARERMREAFAAGRPERFGRAVAALEARYLADCAARVSAASAKGR
ncbi:MAG: hypothetical protein JNM90_04975 [Burkholderiales bacterium]|nr:hypothetical protein [Burkholderiales bacterium]